MFSLTPLGCWTLEADGLPERLLKERPSSGFTLPGADALAGFADLLGGEAAQQEDDAPRERAPFSLPGMLPEDVTGRASLLKEIDFGRLGGDRAVLSIDHLCGKGRITLGDTTLFRFPGDGCCAEIDLTDALRLKRKQTLTIDFDDAAGAGVPGAVCLRTTQRAHFLPPVLTSAPRRQTLTAEVRFAARRAGEYAVRAACVVPGELQNTPWRESRVRLHQSGEGAISVSFSMRAPRFLAGRAYDAPALKLELYALEGRGRALLDTLTQMTGHPGDAPRAYVPLTKAECVLAPDTLIARAKAAHVGALFLPVPPSPLLARRCTQEGVALLSYVPKDAALAPGVLALPCVHALDAADALSATPLPLAASCRQLCAMSALPPAPDRGISEHELLLDATGRLLNPAAPPVRETLISLRALTVRLRAEAARQGQYAGALCAPGDWREESVAAALGAAFAPLHLSALPLRGAWWAQSFFSATLCAFIPEDMKNGAYAADAALLDAQGEELMRLARDCPAGGGQVGILEGRLPATACALTLRLRLLRSGAVVEAQEIPVFVGERGPLEAAFA